MPIPTKSLREILITAFDTDPDCEHMSDEMVDIAMSAIAEYDPCFAKAAEAGEPTFTLRAQDKTAADIVFQWACIAEAARMGRYGNLFTPEPPSGSPREKIDEALAIADAMRAWPNRKLPD